jgi:hypothetical protein
MGTSLNGLTPAATYTGLIKFGDNSIIGATAKYLSDGAGNDLPISVSTTNVGISTNNPTALLQINSPINNNIIKLVRSDDTTQYLSIVQSSAPNLYDIGPVADDQNTVLRFYRNNYIVGRVGGTESLRLIAGKLGINLAGSTPSANLQIKGSGSTSATSTFLFQNSAGNNILTCTDDGKVFIQSNTLTVSGYSARINNLQLGLIGSKTISATGGDSSITIDSGGVAISGGTALIPNASALLQVESTTRGFLPPRMTTTQKNAIATPAAGLIVFDTTLAKLCVYSGSAWQTITSL